MICPVCNKDIRDGSTFCINCGVRIPRCPTCGTVITKRMQVCSVDGTLLPEEILSVFPPETAYAPESETVYVPEEGLDRKTEPEPDDTIMFEPEPEDAIMFEPESEREAVFEPEPETALKPEPEFAASYAAPSGVSAENPDTSTYNAAIYNAPNVPNAPNAPTETTVQRTMPPAPMPQPAQRPVPAPTPLPKAQPKKAKPKKKSSPAVAILWLVIFLMLLAAAGIAAVFVLSGGLSDVIDLEALATVQQEADPEDDGSDTDGETSDDENEDDEDTSDAENEDNGTSDSENTPDTEE